MKAILVSVGMSILAYFVGAVVFRVLALRDIDPVGAVAGIFGPSAASIAAQTEGV